jgi:hypothetical protein
VTALTDLLRQRYGGAEPQLGAFRRRGVYTDSSVATAVKPRLPQAFVLGRDAYAAVDVEQVRAYDERMTRFYLEQGMSVPNGGCSRHSAERVKSAAALNGRDRLVAALQGLGFWLR